MVVFILLVVIAGFILYLALRGDETPIYYHEQVLLVDLIEILVHGSPRDFDMWLMRLQDYPQNRPKYASATSHKHTGTYLNKSQMSLYTSLGRFVEDRYSRQTGQSIDAVREEIERLRLKQANDLSFEKQRMQQQFELEKLRNEQTIKMEYEQMLHRKELDVPRVVADAEKHERQLLHDRWLNLLNMMSMAMQTTVLVKEELRNNPLGEELVARFNRIYDELRTIDPSVKLDQAKVVDAVQKLLLRDAGFDSVV